MQLLLLLRLLWLTNKGDNGILRNKLKTLTSEIDEHSKQREEMEAEQRRLQAHIKALERDIVTGKKEVEERDETIQDKEKRIYDLKKKNQELDKFKFVLDYKIKELKKQVGSFPWVSLLVLLLAVPTCHFKHH